MAVRRTTSRSDNKPSNPRASNPGGVNALRISPSVKVLGMKLLPGLSEAATPRKPFTNAELANLKALGARIKALETKAAADAKANARIIKKQDKQKPLTTGRGATKPVTASSIGAKKKPVVKVRPRGGAGGGGGIGGGLLDTMNR